MTKRLRMALRKLVITEVGPATARGRHRVSLVGYVSSDQLAALREVVFSDVTIIE